MSGSGAEFVSVAHPPVAQPIVCQNPVVLWEFLRILSRRSCFPGCRAALDSGFNFKPNLSIGENRRRVQEWNEGAGASAPQLSSTVQAQLPTEPDNPPATEMGRLSLMDSIFGNEFKDPSSVPKKSGLEGAGKRKRKRWGTTSDAPPASEVPPTGVDTASPNSQVSLTNDPPNILMRVEGVAMEMR